MGLLEGMHVAVLVTHGFEEEELVSPMEALQNEGAGVAIIAPGGGKVQAFKHFDKSKSFTATALEDTDASRYEAVVLPGGALNADQIRMEPAALQFVLRFDQAKKPIAAICHAPWLLVSAGVVKNRTLTSYRTLRDDIQNAGGNWVDREVVRDGNWVTSRKPADLPAFNREMTLLFAEHWDHARSSLTQAPADNDIVGGSHPGLGH